MKKNLRTQTCQRKLCSSQLAISSKKLKINGSLWPATVSGLTLTKLVATIQTYGKLSFILCMFLGERIKYFIAFIKFCVL